MKRFTTLAGVFSISILAVWAIFQMFSASQAQGKNGNTSAQVQPAGNEAAIPVTGPEDRKIAPVFDASGAVVSDPSGTMLNVSRSEDMRVAPVFDAHGAVVSDPSGAMWSAGNMAIPATGANRMVAPVFDATGTVISDPSGTILNSSQP
jgi:hypothetical protein